MILKYHKNFNFCHMNGKYIGSYTHITKEQLIRLKDGLDSKTGFSQVVRSNSFSSYWCHRYIHYLSS